MVWLNSPQFFPPHARVNNNATKMKVKLYIYKYRYIHNILICYYCVSIYLHRVILCSDLVKIRVWPTNIHWVSDIGPHWTNIILMWAFFKKIIYIYIFILYIIIDVVYYSGVISLLLTLKVIVKSFLSVLPFPPFFMTHLNCKLIKLT